MDFRLKCLVFGLVLGLAACMGAADEAGSTEQAVTATPSVDELEIARRVLTRAEETQIARAADARTPIERQQARAAAADAITNSRLAEMRAGARGDAPVSEAAMAELGHLRERILARESETDRGARAQRLLEAAELHQPTADDLALEARNRAIEETARQATADGQQGVGEGGVTP